MINSNKKFYLLNYIFIISLIILLINDQFLKFYFSNWFTGKLSDFTGIIVLHLLITFLFPKSRKFNLLFVIGFFLFWKSPFSEFFIKLFNFLSPIRTERVVDYTDLIAFSVLPLTYYFILNLNKFQHLFVKKLNVAFVLIPTFLVLLSESPPLNRYYTYSNGNLRCNNCKTDVGLNKDELVKKLNERKFKLYVDYSKEKKQNLDSSTTNRNQFYKIDQLIVDKDTLNDIDFTFLRLNENKTRIYFNGLNMKSDLTDTEVKKRMTKYYKRILFEELKQKLK